MRLVRMCLVRKRRMRRVSDSGRHSHILGRNSYQEGQECRSSRSRRPMDTVDCLALYDTRDPGAFAGPGLVAH